MRKILLLLAFCPQVLWAGSEGLSPCKGTVALGDEVIDVEIVADNASRARGLMYRSEMPENAGMLFLFPEDAPRNFWMKNTVLPLDILFYEKEGALNRAHRGARPFDLTAIPGFGSAVLEVNAGFYLANADALETLAFKADEQLNCPDNQWRLIQNHPMRH